MPNPRPMPRSRRERAAGPKEKTMVSLSVLVRRYRTAPLVGLLAMALIAPILAPVPVASASDALAKQEWQDDYRKLLREKARLERNVESARVNYMRANRRNYPRGKARQQFVIDGDEAKRGLVKIEEEIEQLRDESRRAGALPGWFAEVDDEPIGDAEPAARADDDEGDREGRNPLYADDDE